MYKAKKEINALHTIINQNLELPNRNDISRQDVPIYSHIN